MVSRDGTSSGLMAAPSLMLSIVVPVHDEEETLPELHRRLAAVLDELNEEAEVVLVDDGSRDTSFALMREFAERDRRFKVVRLSRNFGHQIALSAGVDLALGDAVVIMDADLQHPPELIPELVARWREGYEVVYGVMQQRPEGRLKRATARLFYRLLRRLSDVDVPGAAGDFRLVDRRAVEAFKAMRERNRYVRGMFSWIGYRQVGVPYRCAPRYAGRTKYTLGKMIKLGTDGILSFSTVPLRVFLNVGFVVSMLAMLFGIGELIAKLAGAHAVPGWASILTLTAFIGGIQLIVLGVMGEYVGRIYDEVKRRPLYLVSELHGFDAGERPTTPSEVLESRSD